MRRATRGNIKFCLNTCSTSDVLRCYGVADPRHSTECECDRCVQLTGNVGNIKRLIRQSRRTPQKPEAEEKAEETDRFDLVEIDISNNETYIRKLLTTLRRLKDR